MNTAEVTEVTDETPQHIKGIGIETMLELRDKNLNHGQIATLLGCDRSNVSRRLAKYKPTLEKIDRYKKNRADIYAHMQTELLAGVTSDKIKDSSATQLITGAAILYDKERLERGQSTANMSVASLIDTHSANLDAISGQIAKLSQELDVE
jgi:predicted transcriptional regulator